jgi:hypothetical protein
MAHSTFPDEPVLFLLFRSCSLAWSMAAVKTGGIVWFIIARVSYEVF